MLLPTNVSERLACDLWKAVDNDSVHEVMSLLDKGADPNHQLYWSKEWISEGKWPPLFTACCIKYNLEMAQVLVQRGADVDKGCGEENWTLLHGVCEIGFEEAIEYLITEANCKIGKLILSPHTTHYIVFVQSIVLLSKSL